MWAPLRQQIGNIVQPKGERREGRSPFSAKSVLFAGGLFVGALGYSTVASGEGSDPSWLQSVAPGTMALSGSYLGGFLVGWEARRALKMTALITGLAIAATGLLAWLGLDASAVQAWLNSMSAWAGENIEGARHYLVSLLPSAGAAGVGGVLGFKRK